MIKLLEKYSAVSWIFVIIIVIMIFYISSLTFGGSGGGFGWKTTAYHFLAFFSLAFFLLPALVKGKTKGFIWLGIIVAVLYGISDEVHQLFVPTRHFAFSDIMVNSCGILFSSLIYTLSLKYRKKDKKSKTSKRPKQL